jgi:cation:H+ antiporter
MLHLFLVAGGIALLYFGGEALVSGSSALARKLGMSPLVVGLTVVAFGTSAPELAATLTASFQGVPEVAFGNVVGSNICNIGLILGLAALVYPVAARGRFLWREMPILVAVSLLMVWFVSDGSIGRLEGVALLVLLGGYLWLMLRKDKESARVAREFAKEYGKVRGPLWASLARVVVGIVVLIVGAKLLVVGAISIARAAGVSDRVIGLTLVAVGTSLPELASSLVAAARKEGDILLGNIVGSNIFNILAILGVAGVARPLSISLAGAWVDLWVMVAFSVLLWPFLVTRRKLDRWEGGLLLAGFAGYFGWLFL